MHQKDLTFFLIDDDEDEHELFQIALEEVNARVRCITSSSCSQALELLKKKHVEPDLIFLDLNMPVVTGRECLEELKDNAELKHIPVIIFSTSADPSVIADSKTLGAHDYIVKPSRIGDLTNLLNKFVSPSFYANQG